MSFHKQNSTCSACGYPAARLRRCIFFNNNILDGWSKKVQQRKGPGTGRMSYTKTIPRIFKNNLKGIN
jgi:large subunit ribosomal protein L37e